MTSDYQYTDNQKNVDERYYNRIMGDRTRELDPKLQQLSETLMNRRLAQLGVTPSGGGGRGPFEQTSYPAYTEYGSPEATTSTPSTSSSAPQGSDPFVDRTVAYNDTGVPGRVDNSGYNTGNHWIPGGGGSFGGGYGGSWNNPLNTMSDSQLGDIQDWTGSIPQLLLSLFGPMGSGSVARILNSAAGNRVNERAQGRMNPNENAEWYRNQDTGQFEYPTSDDPMLQEGYWSEFVDDLINGAPGEGIATGTTSWRDPFGSNMGIFGPNSILNFPTRIKGK